MTCARCLYQAHVCLCASIPTVANATRIVIIRHHLERHRSSNTGRLAHLALANSEIVDYGDGPPELPALDGAYLLYPLGQPVQSVPAPPPRQLVVLDATWSQARRMYRKLTGVRGLPILHVADDDRAPKPVARLRASPAPGYVSTIEAIARALRMLDGDAIASPLEQLYELAVDRARVTGRLAR
jgi:DTW domain-containing protein YfiP